VYFGDGRKARFCCILRDRFGLWKHLKNTVYRKHRFTRPPHLTTPRYWVLNIVLHNRDRTPLKTTGSGMCGQMWRCRTMWTATLQLLLARFAMCVYPQQICIRICSSFQLCRWDVQSGLALFQAKAIAAHEEDERDVITGFEQKTHYGRPNWDDIFKKTAETHPNTHVGVFFCGVAALSTKVKTVKVFRKPASTFGAFITLPWSLRVVVVCIFVWTREALLVMCLFTLGSKAMI